MVDSTSLGGGGGVSVGDIVSTTRTTTEAGNVLLPLFPYGRILSASELTAYPLLAAQLDERFAITRFPITFGASIGLTNNEIARQERSGVTVDGMYFEQPDDYRLMGYDATTGSQSQMYSSGNTSDESISYDMSADGVVRAFLWYDASAGLIRMYVSVNSGASYISHASSVTSGVGWSPAYGQLGSVKVLDDNSVVAIFMENQSTSINYVKVDSAGVKQLDVLRTLPLSLANPAEMRADFTDDLSKIVVSVYTGSGSDRSAIFTSTDEGVNWTRLQGFPVPYLQITSDGSGITAVARIDDKDPNMLVVFTGHAFTQSGAHYTLDGGTTWFPLILKGSYGSGLTQSGANMSTDIMLRNRHCALNIDNGHMLVYLGDDGVVEELGVFNADTNYSGVIVNSLALNWSADGTAGGFAYTTESNDYVRVGGQLTKGKYIPASLQGEVNLKIVADAP